MARLVLYAGPSADGVPPKLLHRGGMRLRPPAARGDVARLISGRGGPGVIILCDGVFQTVPAVSHAELCAAVDAGWQVWGVSSIGAIRAHELRDDGMRGFGYVYAQFSRYDDFTDDEMCLLHFPEVPYFPVTEALINVRYALEQQGGALHISPEACRTILQGLEVMWFGDRTHQRLAQLMTVDAGLSEATASAFIDWLQAHKIKTLDLVALLQQRPWQQYRSRGKN